MLSKNSSQRKIDVTSEISFICESMCVSILISAKGKTKSKTKQKNDPWFMLLYLNISFSLAPLLCLHYLLGADCLSAVFFYGIYFLFLWASRFMSRISPFNTHLFLFVFLDTLFSFHTICTDRPVFLSSNDFYMSTYHFRRRLLLYNWNYELTLICSRSWFSFFILSFALSPSWQTGWMVSWPKVKCMIDIPTAKEMIFFVFLKRDNKIMLDDERKSSHRLTNVSWIVIIIIITVYNTQRSNGG